MEDQNIHLIRVSVVEKEPKSLLGHFRSLALPFNLQMKQLDY